MRIFDGQHLEDLEQDLAVGLMMAAKREAETSRCTRQKLMASDGW